MKTSLLTSSLTLLATAALAAENAASAAASSAGGGVSVSSSGGKATIVIDVNGKKEVREIDLGNAAELKVGTAGGVSVVTIPGAPKAAAKPWLGLSTDEVSDELRAQLPIPDGTGLIVRGVVDASPAAKAGVAKNDVLLKLDDQILTNADQLRALVGTKKDGDNVRLTFLRRGQEHAAEVKLGLREGGDEVSPLIPLLSGNGWAATLKNMLPLNVQTRSIVVDKDGNVVTQSDAGGIGESVKQLEKTLRESGVDASVIEQTKRTLKEAAESLQKAVGELGATKGDLARRIEAAVKDATQAVEQGRKAAERARQQAEAAEKSAPPAVGQPPVPPVAPQPPVPPAAPPQL